MSYATILPAVLGLAFAIVGYLKMKEVKKLKQSGVRVDGTVFSIEFEPPTYSSSGNSNSGLYYPVIRYVTNEKEWITKRYEVGHFPSKYTEGQTVPVLYDPDKINEFIIDDNSSNIMQVLFWAGIAIIFITVAVFILKK